MPYFNSGHFNSNNFLCNCRSLNGIIAKVKPDVLFPPYKQKLINRSIKQTEKQSFFVYNLCQSSPSLFFYDLLVSRKCSFSILVNYHFQVSFNLMKFCTLPKELKMPWLSSFQYSQVTLSRRCFYSAFFQFKWNFVRCQNNSKYCDWTSFKIHKWYWTGDAFRME